MLLLMTMLTLKMISTILNLDRSSISEIIAYICNDMIAAE